MKQIDFQKIHNYIQKLVDDNSFSGVLGIYADEKTIFEETYGYACFDLLVPNTIDIKFRIGSLTKQFTAASILKLIEMGKVSVNDKLSEYIEDFPNGDSISIKHLLTQSSGIFDYTEVDDFDVEGKKYKTNSQVVSVIRTFPLQFDPGEKWEYSNSNYILLGYIIEKVSGKSFDDFLKSELLTNISMPNTGHDVNNVLKGRSFGYTKNNDNLRHAEYLDMSQPHGAGGMYSTISDLKI